MIKQPHNQDRMSFMELLQQDVTWKSITAVLKNEIHITIKHEYPESKPKKDRNIRRLEVEVEAVKYKLDLLDETIHSDLENDRVKRVKAHAEYRTYLQKKLKALEKKIHLLEEAA